MDDAARRFIADPSWVVEWISNVHSTLCQSSASVREPIWPPSTEPIDERSTGVPDAKRIRQAHARKTVGGMGGKRATVRTAAVKDPAKRILDC
jgi:hypothetical protein